MARKLRPYFQIHHIIVKMNYPVKQVLENLDLTGRMVAWSVELPKYDISFIPIRMSKSQGLEDFLSEFNIVVEEISSCL